MFEVLLVSNWASAENDSETCSQILSTKLCKWAEPEVGNFRQKLRVCCGRLGSSCGMQAHFGLGRLPIAQQWMQSITENPVLKLSLEESWHKSLLHLFLGWISLDLSQVGLQLMF